MKKLAVAAFIVIGAALVGVGVSDADSRHFRGGPHFRDGHHHGGHVHTRFFVGIGPYWGPYPYWYYPPAPYVVYSPPPVVVQRSEPVYIQQGPWLNPSPEPQPQFWYYCQSAGAYYPNVASCPEEWVKVPPR